MLRVCVCVLMCFPAISTQQWPDHLNPPISSPVLAGDMPFTPALTAPSPPSTSAHIGRQRLQFKV